MPGAPEGMRGGETDQGQRVPVDAINTQELLLGGHSKQSTWILECETAEQQLDIFGLEIRSRQFDTTKRESASREPRDDLSS